MGSDCRQRHSDDTCVLLVVEDDPALRFALTAMFERETWVDEVIAVATGTEGLRTLEQRGASAMLTDARLPDLDLEDLLQRATRIRPETRLVVHTGLDEAAALHRAGTNLVSYVQKGSDPLELLRSTRELCRG